MIGSRIGLIAALVGGLGASGFGSSVTVSGPWRRSRNRRDWVKYRATKRAFMSRERRAKHKAQRRARRITRMHAR